jgi:biopolymer transport protein TolQ
MGRLVHVCPIIKRIGGRSFIMYATEMALDAAKAAEAVVVGAGIVQNSAGATEAASQVTAKIISSSADMSVFGLFCKAEFIVQAIIVGLLLASVWSWAIIIDKMRRMRRLEVAANAFEEVFWGSGALEALYERINNRPTDPLMAMFCAAMREWRYALTKNGAGILQHGNLERRIDRVMQLVIAREIASLEKYCGFLASLGSNGMIVGLFGTVLGIMHSFQPIAAQQNASLAVVAPGIAEALLATAVGLIAAIPAAIAYNYISNKIEAYAGRLETFANEFSAIVSRQLGEK